MTNKRSCPWCGCIEIYIHKSLSELEQVVCTECGARGPENYDPDRALELFVTIGDNNG